MKGDCYKSRVVIYHAVAALAFLLGGCGTPVNQYAFTGVEGSSEIVGPGAPEHNAEENGKSEITIIKIDGVHADFCASTIRPGWLFPKTPLNLTSGKHSLILKIAELDSVIGTPGGRSSGSYGDTVFSDANPTIDVNLMTKHVYRFAASLVGITTELILWDETDQTKTPILVRRWMLNGNAEYHRG